MKRCPWSEMSGLHMTSYHDEEWGFPAFNDRTQFEFLVLESAQAGLSWNTVLKKREAYRKAYRGFHPEQVAGFKDREIEALLLDKGIIRNKLKIEASVHNARLFLQVVEEWGSFTSYLWHFTEYTPVVGHWESQDEIPAQTSLSQIISRDMKKRGFRFMGPVIVYSHLQAVGIVNDHIRECFRYKQLVDYYKSSHFIEEIKRLKCC